MSESIRPIIDAYDAAAPLKSAATIPSAWYTDPRIETLERRAVFGATWQMAARLDQLAQPGQFVTTCIGGEPIVVVRGEDGALRAFYNVCRHHAAEVMMEPAGRCTVMRCPYHAW
ncbi:MAG: aromatic ring-hydroxylating dioxygenase subunit alpha, partial [Phycisphaerae bacterium]